ncbi:hypothetical protein [Gottfriedia acidiceleris]|uniref:hypothetical protein n=1 Tax=Gottfriedia acidiceleris TaxID=371036 RepID=UPI0014322714|nr:hypothetical protein [Gottfriedia acidiceleris]
MRRATTEFKLLESNYLKENDYVLDTPSPVQELNVQTIQTIKVKLTKKKNWNSILSSNF